MRVHLFVPCYVDQLTPEVAWATLRVLERLGHTVEVPNVPTCCGQPALNSGFRTEARRVAHGWLAAFAGAELVVAPSGSCVAQIRGHMPELFHGTADSRAAADLAARTHELSEFLVDVLGVEDVGAHWEGTAAYHDGCHGRSELGLHGQARTLLGHVRGLRLLELPRPELCCGFGGTFAVKLPELSVAMADAKLGTIRESQAPLLISGEVMCLTHLQARARELQRNAAAAGDAPVRVMHLAQLLAGEAGA